MCFQVRVKYRIKVRVLDTHRTSALYEVDYGINAHIFQIILRDFF